MAILGKFLEEAYIQAESGNTEIAAQRVCSAAFEAAMDNNQGMGGSFAFMGAKMLAPFLGSPEEKAVAYESMLNTLLEKHPEILYQPFGNQNQTVADLLNVDLVPDNFKAVISDHVAKQAAQQQQVRIPETSQTATQNTPMTAAEMEAAILGLQQQVNDLGDLQKRWAAEAMRTEPSGDELIAQGSPVEQILADGPGGRPSAMQLA